MQMPPFCSRDESCTASSTRVDLGKPLQQCHCCPLPCSHCTAQRFTVAVCFSWPTQRVGQKHCQHSNLPITCCRTKSALQQLLACRAMFRPSKRAHYCCSSRRSELALWMVFLRECEHSPDIGNIAGLNCQIERAMDACKELLHTRTRIRIEHSLSWQT